jgi:hypothetical protein
MDMEELYAFVEPIWPLIGVPAILPEARKIHYLDMDARRLGARRN